MTKESNGKTIIIPKQYVALFDQILAICDEKTADECLQALQNAAAYVICATASDKAAGINLAIHLGSQIAVAVDLNFTKRADAGEKTDG